MALVRYPESNPDYQYRVWMIDTAQGLVNVLKQAFEPLTDVHLHQWDRPWYTDWKCSGGSYGLLTGEEHRDCAAKGCHVSQTQRYQRLLSSYDYCFGSSGLAVRFGGLQSWPEPRNYGEGNDLP